MQFTCVFQCQVEFECRLEGKIDQFYQYLLYSEIVIKIGGCIVLAGKYDRGSHNLTFI